ncbi:EF-hand domain-containing protein [Chiayiivirga flava]|uniref:Ca2+-binding EF-hand superfamily protein n=1 Tax=Chiayiivirga flava TaxID=659595 RepID=A0A7W8D4R1_9GAMM|nr:EF-hand domain-containing protein [Chiayiivirga flava]MBB5207911.1 Ca2+-binding EF-hand superfamily protein [Chiayiivirga flava]
MQRAVARHAARNTFAAVALLGAAVFVSGAVAAQNPRDTRAAIVPNPRDTGAANAQNPRDTGEYLRLFDTDGDGRVSLVEYQEYLSRGFMRMDRNGDGAITADELPPGTRARKLPTLDGRRRELSAAFDRQDLDNSGYLDAREMAAPPQ